MGMGHAVYKTYDPRAQVLKALSRKLAEKTGERWYSITEKVEQTRITSYNVCYTKLLRFVNSMSHSHDSFSFFHFSPNPWFDIFNLIYL